MGITGRGNRERQLATRPGRSLASRRHQSRLTKTPMIRPGEVHQISGMQPQDLCKGNWPLIRLSFFLA